MVLDNIEATFELNPCTNYHVTPQISCTGCDPAAICNTDPWTHTNIMKLHRLRNRGLGGLSPLIF